MANPLYKVKLNGSWSERQHGESARAVLFEQLDVQLGSRRAAEIVVRLPREPEGHASAHAFQVDEREDPCLSIEVRPAGGEAAA